MGAISRTALDAVLERAAYLHGDDRDFFRRVWATDPEVYRKRIGAAGFEGLGRILDAGCGFGQWTLPLAETNAHVQAIDVSDARIRIVCDLAAHFQLENVAAERMGVESTGYADSSFDGIFSYSVIYFTDFRQTIAEFSRLLRPGGRLYLCTNGLGWYLHNLLANHNASATFDPRAMAVATLENSLAYYATGERTPGRQLVTPSPLIRQALEHQGFELLATAPEGGYAVPGKERGVSFYEGEYCGAEGVYEVHARKLD